LRFSSIVSRALEPAKLKPMLGPADLADWTFDERDLILAMLRRHDGVHALITGADSAASAFPPALRGLARRFAAHEDLTLADLQSLAQALGMANAFA
jgi:hypothetical protein